MYKGNIFKSHMVVVQNDDTMIIDNNERVARKIENLEDLMVRSTRNDFGDDSLDGFIDGLDPELVEA